MSAHPEWPALTSTSTSTSARTRTSTRSRVLVVAPEPFYQDRGTPIAVAQLTAALSTLGADVDLLTYPVGEQVNLGGVRVRRCANPFRVSAVPIGFSIRKLLLDLSMIWELMTTLAETRYEVVHALEEMALPAVLLSRRKRVPVIYDMQSSLPQQLCRHQLFRSRPAQLLLRRVERWVLRHASAVICSAGLIDYVKAIEPRVPVCEWRFAGQRRSGAIPSGEAVRKELGLQPKSKVVLYAGTFEPYQGIDTLIESMPMVIDSAPESVFVLVGAAQSDRPERDAKARTLVESGKLFIVPRRPRAMIPAFLAMSNVLVSPRMYGDNIPLKIFDYMLSGKVIVATDIPAHRSLLDEDTALLVKGTPEAIAGGIIRALKEPELAAVLGAAAVRRGGRSSSQEALVGRVREVYRTVLSHGRGADETRVTDG